MIFKKNEASEPLALMGPLPVALRHCSHLTKAMKSEAGLTSTQRTSKVAGIYLNICYDTKGDFCVVLRASSNSGNG